jgi:hypothetical protein
MVAPVAARVPVGPPSESARAQAAAPVLPPQARPYGYSLDSMARLLAAFNVGDHSAPPPNSPFQLLYEKPAANSQDFNVAPGTPLYVPLVFSDNGPPVVGHFPADLTNRAQVLHYWYSQSELGMTTMELVIDGKVVPLGAGYVTGFAPSAPLPDGATQYITAGAFIAPLAPGVHTIEIHSKATGDALRQPPFDQVFPKGYAEFSTTYRVTVR